MKPLIMVLIFCFFNVAKSEYNFKEGSWGFGLSTGGLWAVSSNKIDYVPTISGIFANNFIVRAYFGFNSRNIDTPDPAGSQVSAQKTTSNYAIGLGARLLLTKKGAVCFWLGNEGSLVFETLSINNQNHLEADLPIGELSSVYSYAITFGGELFILENFTILCEAFLGLSKRVANRTIQLPSGDKVIELPSEMNYFIGIPKFNLSINYYFQ